jgi:hypothetical protein
MKANPDARIAEWAAAIGKSRTSTVSALHRLRAAGLADSAGRVWRLTDPAEIAALTERGRPPKEAPRWTTPSAHRPIAVATSKNTPPHEANPGMRTHPPNSARKRQEILESRS